MHLDSHQHFWRYHPAEYGWIAGSMHGLKRDFLPSDLQPLLEASGMEGCVAVQARQSSEETRWLLELAGHYAFIKAVVGWVDLRSPALGVQLAACARHSKMAGVRHVVQDEPDDFMRGANFRRGVAQLAEFGLTYDLLLLPKHLRMAVKLVEQFPTQPFVLDHLAKPPIARGESSPWREDLWELARWPNVHCKLSGMVTEANWWSWQATDFRPYLDATLEAFGPERVMIGSDWPVCTLAGSYEAAMGIVLDYVQSFTVQERAGILGGNCARFYGIQT